MSNTYAQCFTFFEAPDSAESVQVFQGRMKSRSDTADQQIAYSIRVNGRKLAVYASPATSRQLVVSGEIEGLTKARATVGGYGSHVAALKKQRHSDGAWSFVDFRGTQYRWDVRHHGARWRLYDEANTEVAVFRCAASDGAQAQGHLYIREIVSDDLLVLALLTSCLVHSSARAK